MPLGGPEVCFYPPVNAARIGERSELFPVDGLCNTPTGAFTLTAVEAGGVSGFV